VAARGAAAEAARGPETYHPDLDRLALHAAGQLQPVERVVVEAHLSLCPPCAERFRELLEPGATWLRALEREPPGEGAWARLERRLTARAGPEVVRPSSANATSAPARPALAGPTSPAFRVGLPPSAWAELDAPAPPVLAWRPVPLSRARYAVLAEDGAADIELVLIDLPGGCRFPAHVHLGHEEVVVLAGGYGDAYGHFVAGAYHRYAPGTEHSALTDPGETCVAVGLIERGLRFRGLLGVLQWLFDPRIRAKGIAPGAP
jgi:putative transcriptional regulator